MRFEELADDAAVAAAAADLLQETIEARHDAVVVLPAGRTPLRFFDEVLRRAREGRLDLAAARLVQLDEYVGVAAQDPRSFQSLLRAHLLAPLEQLGRSSERDLLLDGGTRDARAEVERHAARLAQLGGADVVFLGIGVNGHVAFNEPGATLDQHARVVELASATKHAAEQVFGHGKAPSRGMTLGLHEMTSARRVVLLATGAAKASIVAALFDEPPSPQRPASLLLGHPDFTILADAAAAPVAASR
jgi:glucosamine-6-phosphate deaminase